MRPHLQLRELAIAFVLSQEVTTAQAQLNFVETKIQPLSRSEAARTDHMGSSLAVSGNRLAISVPGSWTGTNVDIYERAGDHWTRETQIGPSDDSMVIFGRCLALDGDILAVAAYGELPSIDGTTAIVCIYEREMNGWAEVFRFESFAGPYSYPPSLAVSGDRVVMGVPFEDWPIGENAGAIYVFRRQGGAWAVEERIGCPDAVPGVGFGHAVDMDGDELIVSAIAAANPLFVEGGAAYIFEFSGTSWELSSRLSPMLHQWCWNFGKSVAIRGDRAVVGQGCDDSSAGDAGSVTTFERGASGWTATDWLAPDLIDEAGGFGSRLSLEHDRLAIGAPSWGWPDSGRSFVFLYDRDGGNWNRIARLGSPTDVDDQFGAAVSLEAGTLVVGAPGQGGSAGPEQGAVHVFEQHDDTWESRAVLMRSSGDVSIGDEFGASVAFEPDLLVVAAPADAGPGGITQGAVYIFEMSNGHWVERGKLEAPDAHTAGGFGGSLAMSNGRLVVGAPSADSPAGMESGAAYVFVRNGLEFTMEARLYPDGGMPYDRFGNAVAIDGDRIVVGAYRSDRVPGEWEWRGAAYVYRRTAGTWEQESRFGAPNATADTDFGWSVALSGANIVVGAPRARDPNGWLRGAAFVYSSVDGVWGQEARLSAPELSESFGHSLDIQGTSIVVGAPRASGRNSSDLGRVIVFSRESGAWERQAVLSPGSQAGGARFGGAVDLQDDRLAIGAGGENDSRGAAYLFVRADLEWQPAVRVAASDSRPGQSFGSNAIRLDGDRMVVGVPYDGHGHVQRFGAVYEYLVHCAGDVDGDWDVGMSDLALLLARFGLPAGAGAGDGDVDHDEDVDLSDLALLLGRFGAGCP